MGSGCMASAASLSLWDFWGFGLCLSSGILRNTAFRKLDLFPSSGEGEGDTFGSVRKELTAITGQHMSVCRINCWWPLPAQSCLVPSTVKITHDSGSRDNLRHYNYSYIYTWSQDLSTGGNRKMYNRNCDNACTDLKLG
jgi:hypothetical protein